MTARTFDPFAIERPTLRLGDHGEWELGETHDARDAKFREVQQKFFALTEAAAEPAKKGKAAKPAATLRDYATVVGELVSVACINADDAKSIIVDMCDYEKHGDDARGMQTLIGIVEFLADYTRGELAVGEA